MGGAHGGSGRGAAARRGARVAVGLTVALLAAALTGAGAVDAAGPGSSAGTDVVAPPDVVTWGQTTGTDGRGYLADAQGRARQLRGFNIKTRDPAGAVTDDLLAAGQARGFDLLRLSVYWDQFEPVQDQYDDAYLADVRTAMDRAAAHGFLVVIDFHQDVFGPKFGDHGIPLWATRDDGLPYTQHEVWLLNYLEPAVQAAWDHLYEDADLRQAQIDAWTTVANRFKGHPALLGYDLLNEPFGQIRAGETLGEAIVRVQAVQLTAMFQRLTDAIHGVDPDHWVLFEPPNVASLGLPISLGRIDGTKLAFFPHFYDPSIESATYTPGAQVTGFDPAFFDKYEAAIHDYPATYGYPTLFGEWGIAHPENPGMVEFVARSLALMDRQGSGWTMFNWCKGSGYCPLDAQGQDRPAIGQIVAPWARAIAGHPTSFGFDPATRRLTVTFVDGAASGPTEIRIPASSYPDGHQVATSDAAGTWSSTFDPATGTLDVTTAATGGAHTICVGPAGADLPCGTVTPTTTTPAVASVPEVPAAAATPAATPVAVTPAFTG